MAVAEVAESALTLSESIGAVLRRVRRRTARTLDNVAEEAGLVGLKWARSTVANLEAGRRAVSAEELLLLPEILSSVGDETITLTELLQLADEEAGAYGVRLNGSVVVGRLGVLANGPKCHSDRDNLGFDFLGDDWDLWGPVDGNAGRELLGHAARRVTTIDRRLSQKVSADPRVFVIVSYRLWERSFAAERDERVGRVGPDEGSGKSLQGLRSQVARELLAEMEPSVRAMVQRLESEPV